MEYDTPISSCDDVSSTYTRKRKLIGSDEDISESENPSKRSKWNFVLEQECPNQTAEDDESIHSYQSNETVRAYDTPDTSYSDDIQPLTRTDSSEFVGELEVADDVVENNSLSNTSVSEPQDVTRIKVVKIEKNNSEISIDLSDQSSDSLDSEEKYTHFRLCVNCWKENDNEWFQYCNQCFKKKKSNRPTHQRRLKRASNTNVQSKVTNSNNNELTQIQQPSGEGENSTLKDPCSICFNQPKNGVFVHLNVIHRNYCYECAVKAWETNLRRCPICMQKVSRVHKDVYFS